MQEQNLELSGRSAYSQQFQHNNQTTKALSPELWEKEVGMHLANKAACNIQLSHNNQHSIKIELAETQLEKKKKKKNKKKKKKKKNKNNKNNNKASQQLGHQQLRQQQQLQLPQLCRQQPDTAISRQLPKELLSATSSQTAAWPAATLTCNFSFSKQELSDQHLQHTSFYNNQLVNQELVHNKLQRTDAFSIWVVEQQLAPTRALQHSKASLSLPSRSPLRPSSSSLMSTRFLSNLALSFDNPNFSNISSSSLGSGNLNQLSAETKEQKKPIFKKLCQNNFEHILENKQLSQQVGEEQLLQLQLLSNKFLEKNFGQQLAENELQQNLSQDQQQLQDSNLAQKIFQQLSFRTTQLHREEHATMSFQQNFEIEKNKAFQKNFLAFERVSRRRTSAGEAACRQQLYPDNNRSLQRTASDSLLTRSKWEPAAFSATAWFSRVSPKQLHHRELGYQLTLKEPLGRTQNFFNREHPKAQLEDKNFLQNTLAVTSLQTRPSARQLQRQQLEEENFTANQLRGTLPYQLPKAQLRRQQLRRDQLWGKDLQRQELLKEDLQRQQLTRRKLQHQQLLRPAALKTETFRQAASETAAWQTETFRTAASKRTPFHTSSFSEQQLWHRSTFTGKSFQQENFE